MKIQSLFSNVKDPHGNMLKAGRVFLAAASTAGLVKVFTYWYIFDAFIVGAIILVGSLIGYCILALSFKVRNGVLISNLTILDFLLTLCFVEFFTGGLENPTDYWLMIVPMAAFFLTGIINGIFWAIFTALCLGFLEVLKNAGVHMPQPITDDLARVWVVNGIFSAYAVMSILACIYEFIRQKFEKKLQENATRLEVSESRLKSSIEDLNKLNEQLKKMNAMKTEFTLMVSHELKTPLTAIREGISMVLEGVTGEVSEGQKAFLETAKRNADRLARLVEDVLDMQKLETGKMTFYFNKEDINSVVRDAVIEIYNIVRNKGLELRTELEKGLPRISMDRDKIIQVIINLLSNAAKFTGQGLITVSTRREGDMIKVSVEDTGTGIRKKDLQLLFKSFTVLGKAKERKPGSSGLGLAISKKIIQGHGGDISVVSAYGKGSVFTFSLPVRSRDKVLVVISDKDLRQRCVSYIGKRGYRVIPAAAGAEALKNIKKERPELMVIDTWLEDISGFELIGRVRSESGSSKIPIIILEPLSAAGSVTEEDKGHLLERIIKPFDDNELENRIEKLFIKRDRGLI
jgi:signal transduction histidine kinase/CheY-like chemotaxis protein